MKCPECNRPYIERKVFSKDPPIDIIIHEEKPAHTTKLPIFGKMRIQEATDICYVHKTE